MHFKEKNTRKILALLFLFVMLWITMSREGEAAGLSDIPEEGAVSMGESLTQEEETALLRKSVELEDETEPVLDGPIWQEDHYVLYDGGIQIIEEGWKELSSGQFYVDSSGFVTAKLEKEQGNWMLYWIQSGTAEWELQKNMVSTLSDGRMYYFDSRGMRDIAEGWKEISPIELYYVDDSGCVVTKLEQKQEFWRYYDYNYHTAQWEIQCNVWKRIGDKEYYFNASGNCTIIYQTAEETCQKYSSGKMVMVKKKVCRLRDGKLYYFNARGRRVITKGWQKVSGKEYINVGKKGYVTARMKRPGVLWKYDNYNYANSKWVRQKNVWKTVDGKEYYFNKSGNGTKIYDLDTQKCKVYQKGKMKSVKNEITKLSNGKIYYFNSRGIRTTAKGWKVISKTRYVQVGKKGYVTCKMERKEGIWRYYSYNYRVGKWQIQKNIWKSVRKNKYYFNASGNCSRIYNTVTKKCYDVIKGKMTLVINGVREIGGTKYYFGADGVRVSSAGMYFTGSGQLIYVDAYGKVVKEIAGQVLSFETWNGKIISCKVVDGNFMCYYNGEGSLRRKIDLNKPMAALTYDDGPSQYTPAILDTLRQYGGVATFFVVGQRVPAYADTIRNAYNMGCEIGNHTYSHQVLTKVGIPAIQSQIGSTNAAVQNITGVSPVVMRPPGGGQNPTVRSAVGMPLILWSIDTLDWKTRNASLTQAAVLNHVQDGDIILMHDLYNATAEASRVIIPELVKRGYQLVTVSELADCRGGMANGVVYNAFRR